MTNAPVRLLIVEPSAVAVAARRRRLLRCWRAVCNVQCKVVLQDKTGQDRTGQDSQCSARRNRCRSRAEGQGQSGSGSASWRHACGSIMVQPVYQCPLCRRRPAQALADSLPWNGDLLPPHINTSSARTIHTHTHTHRQLAPYQLASQAAS